MQKNIHRPTLICTEAVGLWSFHLVFKNPSMCASSEKVLDHLFLSSKEEAGGRGTAGHGDAGSLIRFVPFFHGWQQAFFCKVTLAIKMKRKLPHLQILVSGLLGTPLPALTLLYCSERTKIFTYSQVLVPHWRQKKKKDLRDFKAQLPLYTPRYIGHVSGFNY